MRVANHALNAPPAQLSRIIHDQVPGLRQLVGSVSFWPLLLQRGLVVGGDGGVLPRRPPGAPALLLGRVVPLGGLRAVA